MYAGNCSGPGWLKNRSQRWPEPRQSRGALMANLSDRLEALGPGKRDLLLKTLQKQMADRAREPVIERRPPSQPSVASFDVVVMGGGLAGQTLARQIKRERPSTRILIMELRPHPVKEAAHKVGESTVEIGAHYFAKVLGLETHLL